jgi:DNA (cytosine-5)-methyltransferase 1
MIRTLNESEVGSPDMQENFHDLWEVKPTQSFDKSPSLLRAIDFYSGVGGWSLGFKMAGIDMIQSYEWWNKANQTNAINNRHSTVEIDIRTLPLESLPESIDIVVGSPPCVEFSYSNRGGSGDISDGLKDIEKFLSVVERLKPKCWAMENVPRVADILRRELSKGGVLERFAHLAPEIRVVDACEWGVPQQRKRCIAGRFDFDLFFSYRNLAHSRTLGDVISGLAASMPSDPVYDIRLSAGKLFDHVPEEPLSWEEERMNREMKSFHPIYNNMAFPDSLNRPGRTVTATCTRVSRESIVIASPEHPGKFRRLTVRERACLQSFPITYQFFGESHAQKLKMVGNAVPPLLTWHIAQAMRGTPRDAMPKLSEAASVFSAPDSLPKTTPPDSKGECYPATRRFRAAIPHLRFKSGVRFELANSFDGDRPFWRVGFYFGNSKSIQELELDEALQGKINNMWTSLAPFPVQILEPLKACISQDSASRLQSRWNRRLCDGVHPYAIVDETGKAVEMTISWILERQIPAKKILCDLFQERSDTPGLPKILKVCDAVIAGCWVGCALNSLLASRAFNPETELSTP